MKKAPSHLQAAGFEYLPEGHLLTQFVDFEVPWAAAYERCIGYTKDFHTHDRLNLTFPRSPSVIEFNTRGPTGKFVVDATRFLWMPANVVHRQDTRSALYDNLAIFPDARLVAKAFRDFQKKYGKQVAPPAVTTLKRRTPLLEALVQQYFTERILEKRKAKQMEGLTFQIMEEILRVIYCPKREALATAQESEMALPTERALRFLESNLFGALDSKAIAQAARTSVPTLFRKFKSEMGMTPRDYILRRRMEEAKTLLKKKNPVGDVALLVGYEDIAAFSKAFKAHVGQSPRDFAHSHSLLH